MKSKSNAFLVLSFVMFCCVSCREPHIWLDQENRSIPRNPDWSFVATSGDYPSPVKYDCAYVAKITGTKDAGETFVWFRFWPDGRCIRRYVPFQGIPGQMDFASLNSCDIGYYRYEGKQMLIEIYYPHFYYGNANYYMHVSAEIINENLVTKKWWWRDDPEPSDPPRDEWRVYNRVPADATPQPNW